MSHHEEYPMQDPDASCGSSNSTSKKRSDKKQQFTIKQRMDMYAFCVLEMEVNGDKVSIKKQQNAVQRVLKDRMKQHLISNGVNLDSELKDHQPQSSSMTSPANLGGHQPAISNCLEVQRFQPSVPKMMDDSNGNEQGRSLEHNYVGERVGDDTIKTVSEMRLDIEYRNYSDFQRVLPLTTQMLRAVQQRFAKYYPKCQPPSRTTIKHVFEKCVKHGTVENIKTRRKATKIPQGDEITNLLINEPQLSLRQMARKLNVSTGTVSRRCKALGLVPDSVTTKHQQLAVAKRQRQIKKFEGEQKHVAKTNLTGHSSSA